MTPSGRGMKLLYLDYDGVLHPEDVCRHPKRGIHFGTSGAGHRLFENAPLLIEALAPYPEVRIVLSTAWVRVLGYSQARKYLPESLRERVIGAIFHTAMERSLFQSWERAHQVLSDVRRRQPCAWVAIDDETDAWPEASLKHFVASDPVLGIAEPGVRSMLEQRLKDNFCFGCGAAP